MDPLTKDDIAAMSSEDKLTALLTIALSNQAKLSSIGDLQKDVSDFKQVVTERCDTQEAIISGFNKRLSALEEDYAAHASETNKRFILFTTYNML